MLFVVETAGVDRPGPIQRRRYAIER